ncbi:head-tail joining protein [Thioclava kandeliae]|uniref:Head-tail adaptor protein n=1 Tax=Thioclava kandeliae TaxID=3070818 RepID=A0ABV1SME9_9RHOB
MSVFAGMASILGEVLGDPVLYSPKIGPPREIQSIFRAEPIEAEDQDGHPITIMAPTWRVRRDLVPDLAKGDRIDPQTGDTYTIALIRPSGSPAADAFLICELSKV